MSEELQRRLAELQGRLAYARELTELQALIEAIASITWLGLAGASQQLPSQSTLWQAVSPLDSEPSLRIEYGVDGDRMGQWLQQCLGYIDESDTFYLSIGNYGHLQWVQVEVQPGVNWMLELWGKLIAFELIVVPHHSTMFLAILEEEHHYDAFIRSCQDPYQNIQVAFE